FRLDEAAGGARGAHEHRAFAAGEFRVRLVLASAVDEGLVLRPIRELLDVPDLQGSVEGELGIEPGEAVLLRGEGLVVPGAQVLELDPGIPGNGEAALEARRQQ